MSRLDLLTVFIVAVCLAALGFLVYKTIQLMNPPELDRGSVESSYDLPEDDSSVWMNEDSLTYPQDGENATSYSDEEDLDDEQVTANSSREEVSSPAASSKSPISTTPPKSSTTSPTTKSPSSTSSSGKSTTSSNTTPPKSGTSSTTSTPKPATTTPKPAATTTASSGKYSVVAGSFGKRANADSHASRLRKLGYASTEVVSTGQFASVVVNRFNSLRDAEKLVMDLRAKGVESFVKTRQ